MNIYDVCMMTQAELKTYINDLYPEMINRDGFLYMRGDIPVLLTAHMDTVHKEKSSCIADNNGTLSSLQGVGGDDRCGIYIILKILELGYRPYVLFCEDEEIGGIGAKKFCATEFVDEIAELKYFLELDRRGKDDAVYYECGNELFKKFIATETEYKENYGSFSDICTLSEATDVASVNLSVGYYNEHTLKEYIRMDDVNYTLKIVRNLMDIDYTDIEQFVYLPEYYNSIYGDYIDGLDSYMIRYIENGNELIEYVYAQSETEALGYFLLDHDTLTSSHIMYVKSEFLGEAYA